MCVVAKFRNDTMCTVPRFHKDTQCVVAKSRNDKRCLRNFATTNCVSLQNFATTRINQMNRIIFICVIAKFRNGTSLEVPNLAIVSLVHL